MLARLIKIRKVGKGSGLISQSQEKENEKGYLKIGSFDIKGYLQRKSPSILLMCTNFRESVVLPSVYHAILLILLATSSISLQRKI